jgi:DNA-binding response OmpR family regulator
LTRGAITEYYLESMIKPFRVLLVDDEERILNFLRTKLTASGYDVLTAGDGQAALEQVQTQEPDLMVLDLVMPGMDGFEVLKELRSFSGIPVIILSARGSDMDKIRGLETGADDYLAKPFNPDELVARVEAVKRRLEPEIGRKTPKPISLGRITIDFERRLVNANELEVKLTRIEWLLLSELARNAGRLMLYNELLARVWGQEYRNDVQLLRTWINRLRKKLEENPRQPKVIRTVPKTGYIIDNPLP